MSTIQYIGNMDVKLLAQTIAEIGYIVIENALPEKLLNELHQRLVSFDISELNDSKIGRRLNSQRITEIRSDKTYWLDIQHNIDQQFLFEMDNLRSILNEQLFLGLFEYQCHYAVYQPESYYSKHIDVLDDQQNNSSFRILSSVLYLNKSWQKHFGGELILYSKDNQSIISTITPHFGSLVLFLSSQFPHEVTLTKQTRYSIAGWFHGRK